MQIALFFIEIDFCPIEKMTPKLHSIALYIYLPVLYPLANSFQPLCVCVYSL